MQNVKVIGISFPIALIQTIDKTREDVSRSRFVTKLLARDLQLANKDVSEEKEAASY
jgi:metal-responsive CopG/Arc/MetJ family transcriptional regulator